MVIFVVLIKTFIRVRQIEMVGEQCFLDINTLEMVGFLRSSDDYVLDLSPGSGYAFKYRYTCHNNDQSVEIKMDRKLCYNNHVYATRQYRFSIEGRDLIVDSCIDDNGDHIEEHPSGYPYIRLPESNSKATMWHYIFLDHLKVFCISRYYRSVVNGVSQKTLRIQRTLYSNYSGFSSPIISIAEYYRKGFGFSNCHIELLSNVMIPVEKF